MSSYGLLRVIPGSELPQNNIAPQGGPDDAGNEEDIFYSELQRHIHKVWEANRNAKLRIEEGLLEDLRAKNGEYHPQKLHDIRQMGGSEIYMMITATKQRAAASWIKDILLPEDEKAWGIDPTPMPELPDWADKAVADRVSAMGGDEMYEQSLREYIKMELDNQAQYSCDSMENLMDDQLAEGKWAGVIKELIDDFTTFSACIMKGPLLRNRKTLSWKQGFGTVTPKVTDEMHVEFERVSPFDIYPSSESKCINDGDLIEHVRFRRGELWNFIGTPGYIESEIRNVLEEYESGRRIWLWNDSERNEQENKHHWWRHHRSGLIDGLHYWGSIQGKHLIRWGLEDEVDDELAEYQIDAIMIGRYVIRVSINKDPLGRRPYQKACYDPVPGGFWGNSIRYLMSDIQEFCNATARSLVNNMAMASGPQVEVNYERLSPLENELEMYPWKIWQTRGSEVGGSPTLQFFQPNSNAAELMAVYEQFELRADDATSIPRYSHGNENVGGAGTTASGLSMLMNSAAKGIKAAIGEFDMGVTRPALEQLYYYNMTESKDPAVKGDAKIVARGANALLLKDMAQQRRNEFLQFTANPIDMEIIGIEGRADLLRKTAKEFQMDGVVPPKEIVAARAQQAAENPPPDPEMVKIQEDSRHKDMDREADMQKHMMSLEAQGAGDDGGMQAERAHQEKLAQIAATKEKDLANIAAKEASDIRQMQEETARIRQRNQDNLAVDMEKHAMQMEQQERQAELDREAEDRRHEQTLEQQAQTATEAENSSDGNEDSSDGNAQPMVLNVMIDNGSGKVKKTIEVSRDESGKTALLTSLEEPVEDATEAD